MDIQFLTDKKGKPISVVVPIRKWESMNRSTRKLKAKLDALISLDTAMSQIKSGTKSKTLQQFLDEN
jgi:hypothetical protein